jgi:hypothetical protein
MHLQKTLSRPATGYEPQATASTINPPKSKTPLDNISNRTGLLTEGMHWGSK